jgi:1,6-anhydro-N-acetylmuramate kinase
MAHQSGGAALSARRGERGLSGAAARFHRATEVVALGIAGARRGVRCRRPERRSERPQPATIEAVDVLGWSGDAIEAQAFGFLAALGLKGLPLSYFSTTGVPVPMAGGLIARP